jgi:hypothetical protein
MITIAAGRKKLLGFQPEEAPRQGRQDRGGGPASGRSRAPAGAPSLQLVRPNAVRPNTVDGRGVANVDTVFPALWKDLGFAKAPDLIYIFVAPYAQLRVTRSWSLSTNPFGHAAIGFTHAGQTLVMNIVGNGSAPMVNILTLEDYLLRRNVPGNEQGGIYERSIYLAAVENAPVGAVESLHAYYVGLAERASAGEARFAILLAPLLNFIGYGGNVEWGNCALHTTGGAVAAGLSPQRYMFPKEVLVEMLARLGDRVKLVSMPWASHLAPTGCPRASEAGLVAPYPGRTADNWKYWNLAPYVDAVVRVPEGSNEAVVNLVERPVR